MKEVLLGIAGVGAEMSGGKFMQLAQTAPASGKIKLPQSLHDPDIHRKSGWETISEEQDTIGDLAANAAQTHQLRARLQDGQMGEPVEIELAACHRLCGGQ